MSEPQAMTQPLRPRLERLRGSIHWGLWLILLATVPVTSFPLVARLLGYTPVAPLALIPLAGLALLWLVPHLLGGGRLPGLSKPLLLFGAISLLSAAGAFFLPLLPYKGQTVISREARALLTLFLGVLFYLTVSCLPTEERRLRSSLQALYLGLMVTLAWSTVQAAFVLEAAVQEPPGISQFHRWFSIRDLVAGRLVGFAYEPSWFGDQLVVLYVPLLLASVLKGFSAVRRWRLASLELVLLLWCLPILVLTQSRISLLSLLGVAAVLIAAGAWLAAGWIAARWWRNVGILRVLILSVALVGIGAGVWGVGWALSRVDPRMSRLTGLPSQLEEIREERPFEFGYEIADRLAFAERVVYWVAGFRVFEAYPLLGVGPGNAGFWFPETMPAYGYRLAEVRAALDPANPNFVNPKNIWVRLLAETGAIGFAAFAIWLVLIGVTAAAGLRRSGPLVRAISLAALLGLAAQILEGFSLDSFALPQMWILPGLVTAAAGIAEGADAAGKERQATAEVNSPIAMPHRATDTED